MVEYQPLCLTSRWIGVVPPFASVRAAVQRSLLNARPSIATISIPGARPAFHAAESLRTSRTLPLPLNCRPASYHDTMLCDVAERPAMNLFCLSLHTSL